MKRKLSPWCKAVKIAMIQKDWGVADLAQAVKMTKEYTSAVINGREQRRLLRQNSRRIRKQHDLSWK